MGLRLSDLTEDERKAYLAVRDDARATIQPMIDGKKVVFASELLGPLQIAERVALTFVAWCRLYQERVDAYPRQSARGDISSVTFPFGKYEGQPLAQIPLSYLDRIYRTMDDSWLKRRVADFLDQPSAFEAMRHGGVNKCLRDLVPDTPANDAPEQRDDAHDLASSIGSR